MKQGWTFRRLIVVIGILGLSVFAWGCGQTAPTAVDMNGIQTIQTQGPAGNVSDGTTDGTESSQWH